MRDGSLIDATSCVNIDGVDHFIRRLAAFMLVLGLILAGRGKQETPIGGEGQSPEERRECLICVQNGVSEAEAIAGMVRFGGCLHGHHGREWHGRCRRGRTSRGE
jgi:hypothetical protein